MRRTHGERKNIGLSTKPLIEGTVIDSGDLRSVAGSKLDVLETLESLARLTKAGSDLHQVTRHCLLEQRMVKS